MEVGGAPYAELVSSLNPTRELRRGGGASRPYAVFTGQLFPVRCRLRRATNDFRQHPNGSGPRDS